MKAFWHGLGVGALTVLLAGAAWGDTLHFKDGRTLDGEVTSPAGADTVVLKARYGTMEFSAETVARIEKNDRGLRQSEPEQGGAGEGDSSRQNARAREMFAQARDLASRVDTGRYGLAIWQEFLEEFPDTALTEAARRELATWKERADGNLVRFGQAWVPAGAASQRNARADKLLAEARSADDWSEAARLFSQARQANPHRVDIPFARAMQAFREKREREFGLALGEVIEVAPGHVAARNNLAVLGVRQKNWAVALMNLSKAAMSGDNDVVLDNLDQVIDLARSDGFTQSHLPIAEAQSAKVVAAMTAAGRHAGKARWGNQWIPQADYQRYLAENRAIDQEIAETREKLEKLDAMYRKARSVIDNYRDRRRELEEYLKNTRVGRKRKHYQDKIKELDELNEEARDAIPKIEREAENLKAQLDELPRRKHAPAYTRRLTLLRMDGEQTLAVMSLDGEQENPGEDPNGGRQAADGHGKRRVGEPHTGGMFAP